MALAQLREPQVGFAPSCLPHLALLQLVAEEDPPTIVQACGVYPPRPPCPRRRPSRPFRVAQGRDRRVPYHPPSEAVLVPVHR